VKSLNPPRFAVWLLEHFGPEINSEALAGDLCEDFRQGRSKAWYWRQVIAAIQWREHLRVVLAAAGVAWLLSWPAIWGSDRPGNWRLDMAIIMAAYIAISYFPRMLRGTWRVLLGLLITALFILLFYYRVDVFNHYSAVALALVSSLVFHRNRQPPPSFPMTYRELLQGDPNQERKRLITSLEGTMEQESNAELRQAYAQAITVLESQEPQIAVKEKP